MNAEPQDTQRDVQDIRRIRVSVSFAGRNPTSGQLLNISKEGCAVAIELSGGASPWRPENGDSVTLELEFEGLDPIEGVAARIQSQFQSDEGIVVRLEFDPSHIESMLPEPLLDSFDRRRGPRVRLARDSGVDVSVDNLAHQNESRPKIVNLSVGGMLLKFDTADVPLSDVDLQIHMSLPGSDRVLEIRARVVNRTSGVLAEYWGIAFNIDGSDQTQSALQKIEAYVAAQLTASLDA